MKKLFSSGNIVLLIILAVWMLTGCDAMKKITGGDQEKEKLTRIDSVYYVQAGAFHNQDYAHERAKELSRKFNYRIEITQKDNLHVIRMGPFNKKPEARQCKNEMIGKGYDDAFIDARLDSKVKQE